MMGVVTDMRFHLWLAAALCFQAALNGFSADATNAVAEKKEARSFKDCLLPAPKNGGFAMDGYILWCSSVIKVGDTYHMFASRWPLQYGLNGWTKYSECVRATSTNLYGPYQFQEVVLQKRPGHWDSS